MVDQPPERNQVEYVYQNQTIIGHRVQTATAPTANSHAEKETYKTNPNIEPQASSPRSSPLPAGCLAVHWRCLGKKVRTRVGAEIPTRLADPLHRYIPTRLADPMPIFNPQGTNFPGVMGTEARVSNGFKGSQCFGHQQGFPPVESDFCRYCLQSSQYQTLSYSKAHTHTKKKGLLTSNQVFPNVSMRSFHWFADKRHGQIVLGKFFPTLAHFVFGAVCDLHLLALLLTAVGTMMMNQWMKWGTLSSHPPTCWCS